jgi:acetyltransferase
MGGPYFEAPDDDVRLRTARPDDLDALDVFVAQLSLTSRVQRFFAPLPRLPASMRDAVARGDPSQHFVVVAHGASIVGLGQYTTDPDRPRCEVALAVADDWQGRGLGRRLLERLLADAARAGLREAVLETSTDNRAMRSLARRAGFGLMPHPEDPELLFGHRDLAPAFERAAVFDGVAAPPLVAAL